MPLKLVTTVLSVISFNVTEAPLNDSSDIKDTVTTLPDTPVLVSNDVLFEDISTLPFIVGNAVSKFNVNSESVLPLPSLSPPLALKLPPDICMRYVSGGVTVDKSKAIL